jgi:hypothetical protein
MSDARLRAEASVQHEDTESVRDNNGLRCTLAKDEKDAKPLLN